MRKINNIFLVSSLVVLSVATWLLSYRDGLVVIYNDAMGHLDVARSVVDGKQPGLAQLGSVWLPLNHILFLVFIWNDWAWHSGFAGSFFSMLAYIIGAIGIYKIIKELSDNYFAAIVGAMAFALNLNLLYLQTTPLTEPLYLVCFILSVLFLIKFSKTDNLKYLLLTGIFGLLQVLTRYDGWFVVVIEGLALIYQQRYMRKISFDELFGKFFLFAMPILFGIVMWLLWNALIFGNALFFVFGPDSAHAQQVVIQNTAGLITKKHLLVSLLAYWYAASSNIGIYLMILAAGGAALFLIAKRDMEDLGNRLFLLAVLLSPAIFNIIALYLGFSIINIPQLHWVPSSGVAEYFNVRYGIMALPFVAVSIGLLAARARKKALMFLLILALVFQGLIMYEQGIITVAEGTTGSNTADYANIGAILSKQVQPGQNILISMSLYSAVIFRSGFPMKDFIVEGDSGEWKEALANPQDYADWVVMGNQDVNDAVYNATLKNSPTAFQKNYKLVYCNPEICVYEKKTPSEMFVYADGTSLKVNGTPITITGVNDYDIAYKSKSQIDAIFQNLNEIGVNTMRFWLFGDGNTDGFQTKSGYMNEARFENADYVIADAAKYHIRLIPVLVNNWTDYGGEQQYLKWTGQNPNDQDLFYTNPETVALFENYINHIIARKNTVTGIQYNNDPTILAWEIVNEPRYSDGAAFVSWFSTIANYIRQEDGNHMITVETDTTSVGKNGQLTINDYCAKLAVDFCTAHLYLYDSNNQLMYNNFSTVDANIKQYIDIANNDNKPFILGEVGIPKESTPFGMQPLVALKTILSDNDSSGALVWNWSDIPDTSYGFSPLGEKGVYTLKDLSDVLGGIAPSTIYIAAKNADEGGYDISIPQPGLALASSTPPSTPAPAQASSTSPAVTVVIATSSTPIAPNPPVVIAPTPTDQGTTVAEANPLPSQVIVVPKSLPYVTNTFIANDWNDGWGSYSTANGVLSVGSNASNTSGAVFLAGSQTWTDYLFSADVAYTKGELFTLVARRTDDSNFLNCVFANVDTSQENISINRIYQGQDNLMGQGEVILNTEAHIPLDDIHVSMKVQGINVQCSIDGATVFSALNIGLFPVLLHGGIGFGTWDSTPNNSQIVVKNIAVTPL